MRENIERLITVEVLNEHANYAFFSCRISTAISTNLKTVLEVMLT